MAHAERLSGDAGAAPTATYSDIDDALHQIVRVANFLSSGFFYDRAFGSVVPTPQFDVLDGLDAPWVTTENISKLHEHWREISHSVDNWATESFELPIPIEREGQ